MRSSYTAMQSMFSTARLAGNHLANSASKFVYDECCSATKAFKTAPAEFLIKTAFGAAAGGTMGFFSYLMLGLLMQGQKFLLTPATSSVGIPVFEASILLGTGVGFFCAVREINGWVEPPLLSQKNKLAH